MAAVVAHRSPLAGSWYPRAARELEQLLNTSSDKSVQRTGAFVRRGGAAFIVPHAGPVYSGAVAATVYRHVQAAGVTRVAVMGFSHRRPFDGVAIPRVDAIETPLGSIKVDRITAERLAGLSPFRGVDADDLCDHSVEIQIPFLQTFTPQAVLLPLYVGRLSEAQRRVAASVLRDLMDEQTVLIASSDLTHYGPDFGYVPFPLNPEIAMHLHELDYGVLGVTSSLDSAIFLAEVKRTGTTVCGVDPIGLLLEILGSKSPQLYQEVLDYDTSGAMLSDYEHSVSYGAVGYFPAESYFLDDPGQAELLSSARFTLDQYQRDGVRRYRREPPGSALLQRGRAFVTMYAQGRIVGCLGRVDDPVALAECVPQLTLAAAYEDNRFGGVAEGVPLQIEVHLLTPLKRIGDPKMVRPGDDGVFLRSGTRRGLLLPSVARRHGLSRDEFLRMLALKAGLPVNVYERGSFELSVFRDQSFREDGEAELE